MTKCKHGYRYCERCGTENFSTDDVERLHDERDELLAALKAAYPADACVRAACLHCRARALIARIEAPPPDTKKDAP